MKQIQLLLFSILLFACSSEHNNEFYLRKLFIPVKQNHYSGANSTTKKH